MTKKTVNGIPMPHWTDTASIVSYLTSLASVAFAVVTVLHPGFTEPAVVQGLLPAVATVIAGTAQIVNVITHRSVQRVAIATQAIAD